MRHGAHEIGANKIPGSDATTLCSRETQQQSKRQKPVERSRPEQPRVSTAQTPEQPRIQPAVQRPVQRQAQSPAVELKAFDPIKQHRYCPSCFLGSNPVYRREWGAEG